MEEMMVDDMDLARDYAQNNSEEAFASLVARHINLVYSVAMRHTRDAHEAQEITQAVFIILARKAGSLNSNTILPAWLCRTAGYVSARALTAKRRREIREQQAYMQSTLNEPETDAWTRISPLLDIALAQLGEKDHSAVVLRFLEGKSFKEVGAALQTSEDTAKKRVNRTLEKLRTFFMKRGVTLSTEVIAGAVLSHSMQGAPGELAKSVIAVAMAKGAAATGSTLILFKGALRFMAWTKLKTSIVVGATLLFCAGTTFVTVKAVARYREDAVWRGITSIDTRQLKALPPMISIRSSKFGPKVGSAWAGFGNKQLASDKSVAKLLQNAYNVRESRILPLTPLPSGQYDYILTLPDHQAEALQIAIKKKFGLMAKKETRPMDVLLLTVANTDAPGLKPSATPGAGNTFRSGNGRFSISSAPISTLAFALEQYLKIPVIDGTGLTGKYDIDIKWSEPGQNTDEDAIKKAIMDQLGFQMISTNQPIEMLVVNKVK